MSRVVLALAIAVLVGAVALWLRRRRSIDAPTQPAGRIPQQLDRADFDEPAKPFLVAVFTSTTCDACRDVSAKAEVLATDEVAVAVVEYPERNDLHQRYRVDAVPLVVIAGPDGAVQAAFLGPVTAADLWAAVAAARER